MSESGAETKVVIRGAAHAEFTTDDGTVTVEGSSATTWAERSLTGVRTMRVDVADAAGDDLLIRDGLVRIARTDRPAYDGAAAAAPDIEVVEADDVGARRQRDGRDRSLPGPGRADVRTRASTRTRARAPAGRACRDPRRHQRHRRPPRPSTTA